MPQEMSGSSEEEIYKRIRTVKSHDDLGNLFEDKSESTISEYDDIEPANLEEVFGTGHEYDYIYEVEEKIEKTVEVTSQKAHISYSDVLRYAKSNGISDTEIIKSIYDGHDINFIALHQIHDNDVCSDRTNIFRLYSVKETMEDFAVFQRLKQMINKKNGFMNRLWTVNEMRELLTYEKYSDMEIKGVLKCDDFAENLFFDDVIASPGDDTEDIHALERIFEKNDLAILHNQINTGNRTYSKHKDMNETACDGVTDNKCDRNDEMALDEKIKYYILKMSKHPYVSTYAKRFIDRNTLTDRLYELYSVGKNGDFTVNDRLRKMIIDQLVTLIKDVDDKAVSNEMHPVFYKTLDVILNTGVERPRENDVYLCMTETNRIVSAVKMNFLGNIEAKFSIRYSESKIEGLIDEIRPKYIFVTGNKCVLRFFYSDVARHIKKLEEKDGFSCKLMYADSLYQNRKHKDRIGIRTEDDSYEKKIDECVFLNEEFKNIFEMLVHVGRRCIYPEIELSHMICRNIPPYFMKDDSYESFTAARRAIALGLSIVGMDFNYFIKCERARIISRILPFFSTKILQTFSDLGFVSRLDILKEHFCGYTMPDTAGDTFVCYNNLDNDVLYNNICTYMRIYRDTFNMSDKYDKLDELLVHPVNYHSARMMCAAAMGKEELDDENNNNLVVEALSNKNALNTLNIQQAKNKKEVVDILNTMVYERAVFQGLCDSKVFEMLIGKCDMGVYTGAITKICDGYMIVRINDNWVVFVRRNSRAMDDEYRNMDNNDDSGTDKQYFVNDQVKVKITEKNVLGLSFRGELVESTAFFLERHPLYVKCTAKGAECYLRQKKQALLLRKSHSNEYGIITFMISNKIFVHYKLEKCDSSIIFNNKQYENVDQIIYLYFREVIKHIESIRKDSEYGAAVRLSETKPGWLTVDNEYVCLGPTLKKDHLEFSNLDDLKRYIRSSRSTTA